MTVCLLITADLHHNKCSFHSQSSASDIQGGLPPGVVTLFPHTLTKLPPWASSRDPIHKYTKSTIFYVNSLLFFYSFLIVFRMIKIGMRSTIFLFSLVGFNDALNNIGYISVQPRL